MAVFVSLSSCKEDFELYESYWGEAEMEINGTAVAPEPYSTYYGPGTERLNVILARIDEQGIERGLLRFYKVPNIVGRSSLENTGPDDEDELVGCVYDIAVGDGHILGDIYYLNLGDDVEDYIEITRIEGDQIWGKFQLSLYRRDKDLGPSPYGEPDYLTITGGEFHTRIWMP